MIDTETSAQIDLIEQFLNKLFLDGIIPADAGMILMTREKVVTFWHPHGVDPENSTIPNVKVAIATLINNKIISKRN